MFCLIFIIYVFFYKIVFFFCLGEFFNVIKKFGLRFGFYYFLYEWFNFFYMKDKVNNFIIKEFVEVFKLVIFNNLKKKLR